MCVREKKKRTHRHWSESLNNSETVTMTARATTAAAEATAQFPCLIWYIHCSCKRGWRFVRRFCLLDLINSLHVPLISIGQVLLRTKSKCGSMAKRHQRHTSHRTTQHKSKCQSDHNNFSRNTSRYHAVLHWDKTRTRSVFAFKAMCFLCHAVADRHLKIHLMWNKKVEEEEEEDVKKK